MIATLRIDASKVAGVYNFIHVDPHPDELVQDIAVVRLNNGYRIEVSFWPEHDPRGSYYMRVIWEDDDSIAAGPIRLKHVADVLESIKEQVRAFSNDVNLFSFATESEPRYITN